jgi:type VI secretion system secreted protein Hcp
MAADVFLKLTGIPGDSTDAKHKSEIEVLSFSSGVSMPLGPRSFSGSAPNERASLSDLNITKVVDSSSAALFKAVCTGQHIGEAVLSVNRADGKGGKVEYLKYTLSDVVISSYQASGSDGSGLPVESVSLNYAKFQIAYTVTDQTGAPKGAKMAGWDVALNKPV